jgi:hypothetical protein
LSGAQHDTLTAVLGGSDIRIASALAARLTAIFDQARPLIPEPKADALWEALDQDKTAVQLGELARVGQPWGEETVIIVLRSGENEYSAFHPGEYWKGPARQLFVDAIHQAMAKISGGDL